MNIPFDADWRCDYNHVFGFSKRLPQDCLMWRQSTACDLSQSNLENQNSKWIHGWTRLSTLITMVSSEFRFDIGKVDFGGCKRLYAVSSWFWWSQFWKINFGFKCMVGCCLWCWSTWHPQNFDLMTGRVISEGVSDYTWSCLHDFCIHEIIP